MLKGYTVLSEINVINNVYLEKKSCMTADDFAGLKSGLPYNIEYVRSRGKFLYICIKNDKCVRFIGLSFGLKGSLNIKESDVIKSDIMFTMNNDIIVYYDQLKFGNFTLYNINELNKKLDSMGVHAYDLDLDTFTQLVHKHNKLNICVFLMRQSIIAGIGNHLKTEILYFSKINPLETLCNLTDTQIKNLYKNITHLIHLTSSYDIPNGIYKKKTINGIPIQCTITPDKRKTYHTYF
jgi:formamidopyrimidine-DNA glycosylase